MNNASDATAPFAAANGSASIYSLVNVLLKEGAPLDHVTIAQRMGVPKYRACRCLAHLEKTGRVVCLRRSRRGLGNLPGIWTLTESGHAFAQFCADAGPGEEDGPWAEGYAQRAGEKLNSV